MADEAADVRHVADALGLDRFSVVGGSGGGPHALACAALLAGRVERVACQSSLAPLGEGGLSRDAWLHEMAPEAAESLAWTESGETHLEARIRSATARMEQALVSDPATFLGEGMGKGDQEVLARPEVIEDEAGGHLPQDLEAEIATTFGWLRTGELPASVG